MNNEQLFELALRFQAPWFVVKAESRPAGPTKSMYITLDYRLGYFGPAEKPHSPLMTRNCW